MNANRPIIIVGMVLLGLSLALLWQVGAVDTGVMVAHAAGPWYVAPGGSDSNSCLDPSTPCATINGAIGKATGGDTIYVATGTYTGIGDEVVLLNKSVTLSGGWNGAFSGQARQPARFWLDWLGACA